MFQYTKATLKSHLQTWVEGNGVDADADFIADLDEVIQRGELRLARLLDLDNLDYVLTATTAGTVPEVFKPSNLINERLLQISIAGVTSALLKRSRAWIEAMNRAGANASPIYYGEYDEDRWFLAPIPDNAYLIYVHGNFRPASITDGSDGTTTWLSTRYPDLLAEACQEQAGERLKLWNQAAMASARLQKLVDDARGISANLQRSDVQDLVVGLQHSNQPTVPPEPAAT